MPKHSTTMCGIFCCLADSNIAQEISDNELLLKLLRRRGPDLQGKVFVPLNHERTLVFQSSTLELRGETCGQPLKDSFDNVLQWNGEIFGGVDIEAEQSDTEFLLTKLSLCKTKQDIFNLISKIRGPFAFVFWQKSMKCLWFGRDILGRRSLCWNRNFRFSETFVLSSFCFDVGDIVELEWEEVPATGVYCIDFSTINCCLNTDTISCYHWTTKISGSDLPDTFNDISEQRILSPINTPLNRTLPESDCLEIPTEVLEKFLEVLSDSISRRCRNHQFLCKVCFQERLFSCTHASAAILFSGGLDSTVIALLADSYIPGTQPIDLLNVAFDTDAPDKETALIAWRELKTLKPQRRWNLVSINTSREELYSERDRHLKHLVKPSVTVLDDSIACALWFAAKGSGQLVEDDHVVQDIQSHGSDEHVAREHEARDQNVNVSRDPNLDVSRDSNLDVSRDSNLEMPRGPSLDKSRDSNEKMSRDMNLDVACDYISPARVVLIGMGADEQLGGYSRHRTIFAQNGWKGLTEEIATEIDRLPARNLGRDDRIVSDLGREPRFPFLDEDVINFLNGLPIWQKCNLKLGRGVGEKWLLRIAAERLGLKQTARHLKRAIQFGSRIAKLEARREKGSDVCNRLCRSNLH